MNTKHRTPEQIREDRNAARRAQRRQEARLRMGRHAANTLVTYGTWTDGRPTATAQDVISKTDAMYGGYLKGVPLTEAEAEVALGFGLDVSASFVDDQRPVREAARSLLATA
ncbi:hypothetical protein [Streptomyces sp. 8L]|uniref:hypothetical protein n=1 Tax=Streptomyces sp. 8L TaxID=2877242 RepID=UPI001CD4B9A1|nr:hypothetical protein [Streptomyces sp. 8L]MCA1224299.1 hypothetical protein [Streptomyces sp. 8L]